VPRQLVPLLEEYLEQHRPTLLNGRVSSYLFVNRNGGSYEQSGMGDVVADITLRYTAKRVTPHLFRDMFAYQWLKEHPTDYLTLSKHLWHKDLKTTLRCYGSKFDVSHATCQVEAWLDKRDTSGK
jgi:site-specific recombinase XerD